MSMILAVTNRKLCQVNFLEHIAALAAGQPDGIILREKDLSEMTYGELAAACWSICRRWEVPLIVNHFSRAAAALGIPELQLSLADYLAGPPPRHVFKRVGVSVHSLAEAKTAERLGADYLIAGHIFETACKRGVPPRGLAFLSEICSQAGVPVFAIGGVNESRVPDVLQAGAAGVCVMSQLMTCAAPGDVVKGYQVLLGK
jgi:thiamine-phosphate pyrophosphorylase